ncbi:ketopantoate reductase family protein [soil metagenome]
MEQDLRDRPITIIGAGAIGGTIGAFITLAGYDVTLVDVVPEHVELMNVKGLRIEGIRGDVTYPVKAVLADDLTGPLDVVLLCVKGHFTDEAMARYGPMLADDGYVVSVQNGLNEEIIAGHVGRERTVGSFVHFAADYLAPGLLQLSNERTMHVGELDGAITPRVEALAAMLGHVMPAEVTDNIWGYLWGKMTWAGMAFVTACIDAPVDDVVNHPLGLKLCRLASTEVYTVAMTQTSKLMPIGVFDPMLFAPGDDYEQRANSAVLAVGEDMRGKIKDKTGMWRDLRVKRRKTEVDMQPGAVVEIGEREGIPTPVNAAVVQVIHEIEAGERGMGWDNLDEIAKLAGVQSG